MPFRSEAQRRWMHANHPEMAERWEKHTRSKNLPEHVGKFSGEEGAWTGWDEGGSSTRQGNVGTAGEGTAESAWEPDPGQDTESEREVTGNPAGIDKHAGVGGSLVAFEARMRRALGLPKPLKHFISVKKLRGEMAGAGAAGATAVSGVSPGMGEGQSVTHAAMTTGKAGPYIGPRGGKWADPQHKIPWSDKATAEKPPIIKTSPQQVISDLRAAGLFKVAKREVRRAVRESGLEVRKHTPGSVSVAIADWGPTSWGKNNWDRVLSALSDKGYEFFRLDGSTGESARKNAKESGAVLVRRREKMAAMTGKQIPEHGGRDEYPVTLLEPGGHVSATRPAGSEPISPPAAAMSGDFAGGMAFEREHGQSNDSDAARARRVQEHLAERPQYYIELKRYLNPDIGGLAGKMKHYVTFDDEIGQVTDEHADNRGHHTDQAGVDHTYDYDDHPGAHVRVDDLWREDPVRYNGKLFIVPAALLSPREAVYQADIDVGRTLHCGNCGAYKGGEELTGTCSRLQAMGGEPGDTLRVHYFNVCAVHRPANAGTSVDGAPTRPLESFRPRALMRGIDRRPSLSKAIGTGAVPTIAPIAGSAPRERTPALPDYQDIYYQPKDAEHVRREREQEETRRMANRARNKATYGFHGSPGSNLGSEPVLRYESDVAHDDAKRSVFGDRALIGQREPQVEAPEKLDQHNAGSPYDEDGAPPGATDYGRVPRSPDERDDETVPDINGRPTPLDPEDVEGEDEEEEAPEEAAGAPFDEDDEDDSLLADRQGRVERSEDT